MSTGLVLSGGGARGIGHVHAVWQIHNRTDWLNDLTLVVGTSTGALVGSMIARGGSDPQRREDALNRLTRVWNHVSFDDVYGRGLAGFARDLLEHQLGFGDEPMGVHTTAPLRSLLKEHLAEPADLNATFWPVRYNLSEEKVEHKQPTDHEEMIEMTRASASIPIYSEPVQYEGDMHVDGGVRDITPLRLIVEHASDLDRAIVVNLQRANPPKKEERVRTLRNLMSQVVEAMTRDIFMSDVSSYERLNAMAKEDITDPRDGEVPTYVPTTWIGPDEELPSGTDFSDAALDRTKRVMREAADRVIEEREGEGG